MRFAGAIFGNIMASTKMNTKILPENSKRVIPSTPLVPITTKAPKRMVKIKIEAFKLASPSPKKFSGKALAKTSPPPVM